MVTFFINNQEIVKNISWLSVSIIAFLGLTFLYIKIFLISREIKRVNEKIEHEQDKLDENEIDNIKGYYDIRIDFDGSQGRKKLKIQQNIEKLKRRKRYLQDEISMYKIFKK